MAISHMIQPFLLLLLVSLFYSPALSYRVDKFFICRGADYPVKVSSLDCSISDGTRTFTLVGNTSQHLRPDEVIPYVHSGLGTFSQTRKEYPLCNVTTACPVAPGPFVFTFAGLPDTEEEEEPMVDIYEVGIEYKKKNLMCIRFPITTSTSKSSI